MSELDDDFRRAQSGDPMGFEDWVRKVELPLRKGLRSFARHVDVEAIVQESLLRLWVLRSTLSLKGENASLRYALTVVRNLALQEAKRLQRFVPLPEDPDYSPDPPALPRSDPPPDPILRSAISDCIARLPAQPRNALVARLEGGGAEPDRALAARLHMRVNTFLQNVVRARRHLTECLESRGISIMEMM